MWIEVHDTLLNHPKVHRLSIALDIDFNQGMGLVVSLWLWGCQYANDGDLSKFTAGEIAKGIKWSGNSDELLKCLIECKLVDEIEGKASIHDWQNYGIRLLKQNRERVKKYRDRLSINENGQDENGRIRNSGSAALAATKNSVSE